MRRAGWVRLWIVLTVMGVPAVAIGQYIHEVRTWDKLDKLTIQNCVGQEAAGGQDALKCADVRGVNQTVFQRQGTTPEKFWISQFVIAFLLDLTLTGLIIAGVYVVRWVRMGFVDPL